jgi:predicted O-methyltransferase YrrM
VLLRVADQRKEVVELGTSKAWTAISLALAQRDRHVTTYDPAAQEVRERYLDLAPQVRDRITFVAEPGEVGPLAGSAPVDFLFIDASHEKLSTIREYEAWRPALADDAVVVFDDYEHPDFPGVADAVTDLELPGDTTGFLFIHRHRSDALPGNAYASRSTLQGDSGSL